MADQPCSCCESGFSGRAFIAYVNFYDGDDLCKRRLRLCQNCIAEHFLILIENADEKDSRDVWRPARGEKQWLSAANSVSIDPVTVARDRFSQASQTTLTSTEVQVEKQTPSATDAGSGSQSRPSRSSKRSKS